MVRREGDYLVRRGQCLPPISIRELFVYTVTHKVRHLAAYYHPTCLFTRLEESSLVPAGFLTLQFLQKT